jgi:hypothetical protein
LTLETEEKRNTENTEVRALRSQRSNGREETETKGATGNDAPEKKNAPNSVGA